MHCLALATLPGKMLPTLAGKMANPGLTSKGHPDPILHPPLRGFWELKPEAGALASPLQCQRDQSVSFWKQNTRLLLERAGFPLAPWTNARVSFGSTFDDGCGGNSQAAITGRKHSFPLPSPLLCYITSRAPSHPFFQSGVDILLLK